jgi:hypothetical protein
VFRGLSWFGLVWFAGGLLGLFWSFLLFVAGEACDLPMDGWMPGGKCAVRVPVPGERCGLDGERLRWSGVERRVVVKSK